MKYHINNKISKREIRKQGKNIIPLELMICASKFVDSPNKKSIILDISLNPSMHNQ